MLIIRQPVTTNETNYDDLFDLNTFSSGMQPISNPVTAQPTTKPEPEQPSEPEQPKDPYGNFDLLDEITPTPPITNPTPPNPTDPTPPVQTPNIDDDIDFGISDPPKPETTDNYNLDLLSGGLNTGPTEKPDLLENKSPILDIQEEPEIRADDIIWLNEREMDNSGKSGIRVFGKWYLKMKSKIFLRVTIWNKSSDVYRSPRIDIRDNFYGILFLKDGVGIPLKTLNPGQFITMEKGISFVILKLWWSFF